MKEQLVSIETARVAKEKGFNEPVLLAYKDGVLEDDTRTGEYCLHDMWYKANGVIITKFKEVIAAPTQSFLLKWLREKHNIDIVIIPERYKNGVNYVVQAQKWDLICDPKEYPNFTIEGSYWFNDNHEYPTYEDALEKGLLEGLKLIK